MRKYFRNSALAALTLAATAMTAQAQGAKSFGIVAGVNFATMTGSDLDGADVGSRTGFVGGLYFAFPVAARVAIEPEVLYSMEGAKINNVNIDINHDYIRVPVLVKYNFSNDGGLHLLAGPSVGFSISCDETDGTNTISCDDDGLQSNTTFGGVVGLGFQRNRLGIEGRYSFDFGDAWKEISAKNSAWQILARIMIK